MTDQISITKNIFSVYSRNQVIKRIEQIFRKIGFFIDYQRIRNTIKTYNFLKGICSGFCAFYIASPNANELMMKWWNADSPENVTEYHLDMLCYVFIYHCRLLEHPDVSNLLERVPRLKYEYGPKLIEINDNKYINIIKKNREDDMSLYLRSKYDSSNKNHLPNLLKKNQFIIHNHVEYRQLYGKTKKHSLEFYITKLSRFTSGYHVKYHKLHTAITRLYSRTQYFKLVFSLIEWTLKYDNVAVYLIVRYLNKSKSHCNVIKNGRFFDPNKNTIITGYRNILEYFNVHSTCAKYGIKNISYVLLYHDKNTNNIKDKSHYNANVVPSMEGIYKHPQERDLYEDFRYIKWLHRIRFITVYNKHTRPKNKSKYRDIILGKSKYKNTKLQNKIVNKRYEDITSDDIDMATLSDCQILNLNKEKLVNVRKIKRYPETSVENIARNMIMMDYDSVKNFLQLPEHLMSKSNVDVYDV